MKKEFSADRNLYRHPCWCLFRFWAETKLGGSTPQLSSEFKKKKLTLRPWWSQNDASFPLLVINEHLDWPPQSPEVRVSLVLPCSRALGQDRLSTADKLNGADKLTEGSWHSSSRVPLQMALGLNQPWVSQTFVSIQEPNKQHCASLFSAGSRVPLKYELQNFGPIQQDCKSAYLCSPASTSCFVNDAATSERETRCAAVTFHNWSLFLMSQNSHLAATIWTKLRLITLTIWSPTRLRPHPSVFSNTSKVWRVPGSKSSVRPRQEPRSAQTGRLAPGVWSQVCRGGG